MREQAPRRENRLKGAAREFCAGVGVRSCRASRMRVARARTAVLIRADMQRGYQEARYARRVSSQRHLSATIMPYRSREMCHP